MIDKATSNAHQMMANYSYEISTSTSIYLSTSHLERVYNATGPSLQQIYFSPTRERKFATFSELHIRALLSSRFIILCNLT